MKHIGCSASTLQAEVYLVFTLQAEAYPDCFRFNTMLYDIVLVHYSKVREYNGPDDDLLTRRLIE